MGGEELFVIFGSAFAMGITIAIIVGIYKIFIMGAKKAVSYTGEEANHIKNIITDKTKELQQEHQENKILKLKILLDNDIISEEEYQKRRRKIEEK